MSDKWQYAHCTSVSLSQSNSGLVLIKVGSDVYSVTIHSMFDVIAKTIESVELRKRVVCEAGEIAENL